MSVIATITTGDRLLILAGVAVIAWLFQALLVGNYGDARGFRFWPLFLSALFIGFPLVLLAVTIGRGVADTVASNGNLPADTLAAPESDVLASSASPL